MGKAAVNRYAKKSVEIEAIQFTGDNVKDVEKFTGSIIKDCLLNQKPCQTIQINNQVILLEKGSYVIKDGNDKRGMYVSSAKRFESTYQIIE